MTVYEYNTGTVDWQLSSSSSSRWIAQSFTIGAIGDNEAFTLTSISIKAARIFTPETCTVVVKAADENGRPTGAILSTGTFDGNALTTDAANPDTVSVSMSSVILQKDTSYIFYVYSGGNTLYVFGFLTGTYTGGIALFSTNSGDDWTRYTSRDLWFQINGTVVACTAWTTESDCTDNGCYWYNDSCHADPFFIHETFRSGYRRRFQNRQIFGHYSASGGGDLRGVAVNQSGHVYVDVEIDVSSGLHVIQQSGAFVQISGQHVYVESGVYVIADVEVDVSSGLHVIQESGAFVQISGQHVYVESGVGVASGIYDGIATIIKTDAIRAITAASGGEVLHSGPILSMTVKALSDNTSDIYLGGVSPYRPYSGFGFQLGGGESKSYDVNNFDACYLCAVTSGDQVTFDGIDA